MWWGFVKVFNSMRSLLSVLMVEKVSKRERIQIYRMSFLAMQELAWQRRISVGNSELSCGHRDLLKTQRLIGFISGEK